jgi:hypothetical protein
MNVVSRRVVRRWPPSGCLLGGLAGVILVTAVWPTVALAREWLWIAGVVVGAAGGVVVQALVREIMLLAGGGPGWRLRFRPSTTEPDQR